MHVLICFLNFINILHSNTVFFSPLSPYQLILTIILRIVNYKKKKNVKMFWCLMYFTDFIWGGDEGDEGPNLGWFSPNWHITFYLSSETQSPKIKSLKDVSIYKNCSY